MPILLLEGLTGAGKSSTLAALKAQLINDGERLHSFYEQETFGELMDELKDGPFPNLCRRLEEVMDQLPGMESDWVILERFHPSYYALHPDWSLYEDIDKRLLDFGAKLVLLSYPAELVAERALYRDEREAEGWSKGFIELYGSEADALAVLERSRSQREEAFELSVLPKLRIDSQDQAWEDYARQILEWADGE